MAKMIVIYQTPDDPTEFDKHYFDVHVPMAWELPGLRSYEVSDHNILSLAGAHDAYLIATLTFNSRADIEAAFATEAGARCSRDRMVLQPDHKRVQMFLFDDEDRRDASI